jgi:ribosome production factor 1
MLHLARRFQVAAELEFLRRYVFPEERGGTKARLQEIGPRFTLKLKSLQTGAFDSSRGEYEWINLAENDKKKRKFAL